MQFFVLSLSYFRVARVHEEYQIEGKKKGIKHSVFLQQNRMQTGRFV